MTETEARLTDGQVCLDLFINWLNHTYGRAFRLTSPADADATAADGDAKLSIAVRGLLGSEPDPGFERARTSLEERIGEGVPASIALWVPLGADLPREEPHASDFVDHVTQAAIRLGPTERSYVPFPVKLVLRKTSETGGVVSVSGGLNPHWARFTERVTGTYDLDSTRLHRVPESDEQLEALINAVVNASKMVETGSAAEIETVDPWTVQRLPGKRGAAIVGVHPREAADAGLAVRRNLKRAIADAAPGLRKSDADLRALVVTAPYPRMDGEGVTTALRGYDPSLYAGLDYVCLVADGVVRGVIQPPVSR